MKRFKMLLLLLLIFFAGLFFVSIDNNSHNISSYKEHPDTYTEGYVCHPATITPYTKASSVYPGPQKDFFQKRKFLYAAYACPARMLPNPFPPWPSCKIQASSATDWQPLCLYDFHASDLDHSPGRWKKALSFI